MKAMILAAGMGTRLGEIGKHTPKSLIPVGGKPMLEHIVGRLKTVGVTEIVINLHYLKEQVEQFLEDRNDFGMKIHRTYEAHLLDTGGGIKNAERYLSGGADFIVYNGDIYSDFDLKELLRQHADSNALATLAVREKCTPDHLICDETGAVTGWINERSGNKDIVKETMFPKPVTFACVHVASARVFSWYAQESGAFSIFRPYMRAVRAGETLQTYDIGASYWNDMGTPENLSRLHEWVDRCRIAK